MFQPDKYKKKDPHYIFQFIKAHPFATFIIQGKELLATHIPVLAEGDPDKFMLYGHIAAANQQHPFLRDGLDALLIFHGAHGYVSSSWYQETDISTWDYSAVHVNVKLKIQSKQELQDSLKKLVHQFEKDQQEPIYYEDLPTNLIQTHLPMITGFWCKPEKIQAIAKLHQGFSKKDVGSVTKNLKRRKDPLSSELSKNILKEHDQED